jgi:hypothetical protein
MVSSGGDMKKLIKPFVESCVATAILYSIVFGVLAVFSVFSFFSVPNFYPKNMIFSYKEIFLTWLLLFILFSMYGRGTNGYK